MAGREPTAVEASMDSAQTPTPKREEGEIKRMENTNMDFHIGVDQRPTEAEVQKELESTQPSNC